MTRARRLAVVLAALAAAAVATVAVSSAGPEGVPRRISPGAHVVTLPDGSELGFAVDGRGRVAITHLPEGLTAGRVTPTEDGFVVTLTNGGGESGEIVVRDEDGNPTAHGDVPPHDTADSNEEPAPADAQCETVSEDAPADGAEVDDDTAENADSPSEDEVLADATPCDDAVADDETEPSDDDGSPQDPSDDEVGQNDDDETAPEEDEPEQESEETGEDDGPSGPLDLGGIGLP